MEGKNAVEDDLSQQGIHIHIDDVGRFLETDELLESAKTEPSWGTLMFLETTLR